MKHSSESLSCSTSRAPPFYQREIESGIVRVIASQNNGGRRRRFVVHRSLVLFFDYIFHLNTKLLVIIRRIVYVGGEFGWLCSDRQRIKGEIVNEMPLRKPWVVQRQPDEYG